MNNIIILLNLWELTCAPSSCAHAKPASHSLNPMHSPWRPLYYHTLPNSCRILTHPPQHMPHTLRTDTVPLVHPPTLSWTSPTYTASLLNFHDLYSTFMHPPCIASPFVHPLTSSLKHAVVCFSRTPSYPFTLSTTPTMLLYMLPGLCCTPVHPFSSLPTDQLPAGFPTDFGCGKRVGSSEVQLIAATGTSEGDIAKWCRKRSLGNLLYPGCQSKF